MHKNFKGGCMSTKGKRYLDDIPRWLLWLLKSVLFMMVALGGLAYIVHYISTLIPNSTAGSIPSPLDLAATSGTIGGLLLVGAFAKPDNPLEDKLKKIGKFFLGAAAFFAIAFLLLEWARITNPAQLNLWQQAMTWVSAIAIVAGIGNLADALVTLVLTLPKL
jgi:hypothetical protein